MKPKATSSKKERKCLGLFSAYLIEAKNVVAVFILITAIFFSSSGFAQKKRTGATKTVIPFSSRDFSPANRDGVFVKAIIIDGDTFVVGYLPKFTVYSPKIFKNSRAQKKYYKLVYHVKKVYPYAKLAGQKLRYYNDLILQTDSDIERKRLMKKCENELEERFGPELKKLTFTQGTILIKLIDRETGQTGYDIVAELRGTFRAFFWQSLGRLFGYNLKMNYDPEGEDKELEEIVRKIECGYF